MDGTCCENGLGREAKAQQGRSQTTMPKGVVDQEPASTYLAPSQTPRNSLSTYKGVQGVGVGLMVDQKHIDSAEVKIIKEW